MWQKYFIAVLGLSACVSMAVGCDGGGSFGNASSSRTPNIFKVQGSESVERMAASCPDTGDFKGTTKVTGAFTMTPSAPSLFLYPRLENQVAAALHWDNKQSPLKGDLTLNIDGGKLIAILPIPPQSKTFTPLSPTQSFNGSIYEDQRFCFHGPITLPLGEAKNSAYLFASGTYTKTDPAVLTLTITIGVSLASTDPKLAVHSAVMTNALTAQRPTSKQSGITGMFVALNLGEQRGTNLFVESELQLDEEHVGAPVLAASVQRPRYHFGATQETAVYPLAVALKLPNDENTETTQTDIEAVVSDNADGSQPRAEVFRNCVIKQNDNDQELSGTFRCSEKGRELSGNYTFKSEEASGNDALTTTDAAALP